MKQKNSKQRTRKKRSSKAKKFSVWDLDETQGEFRPIRSEFYGGEPPFFGKLGLTYGIKELLGKLQKKGYVHAVASAGGPKEYAEMVLDRTGLAPYFGDRVFGKEIYEYTFMVGHRKNYWHIAEQLGVKDMPADMIVIGDHEERDRPMDFERQSPVFIYHEDCCKYDAAVLEIILEKLTEKGKGNFRAGFDELLAASEEITEFDKYHPFKGGQIDLGKGIKVQIGFRVNGMDDFYGDVPKRFVVPTIQNIEAPGFERELVPFDNEAKNKTENNQ